MTESLPERWIEVHLPDGDRNRLRAVATAAGQCGCEKCHHFWDEPWNPGGYVFRAEGDPQALSALREHESLTGMRVIDWDSGPDEKLFGVAWPYVAHYFHIVSQIAYMYNEPHTKPGRWHLQKMIHCHLNASGLSVMQEFRWAVRFALGRLKVWHRYESPAWMRWTARAT